MIARPVRRPGPIPFTSDPSHGLLTTVDHHPTPHALANVRLSRSAAPTRMATQGQGPGSDAHSNRGAPDDMGDSQDGRGGRPGPGTRSGAMPLKPTREVRATFFGRGVLSVRSSTTGALYRFEGHGASLVINPRDALLLGRLTDVRVD